MSTATDALQQQVIETVSGQPSIAHTRRPATPFQVAIIQSGKCEEERWAKLVELLLEEEPAR